MTRASPAELASLLRSKRPPAVARPAPSRIYWDIGVRGDTGPTNHTGGTLAPMWSVLSSGDYTGGGSNNSSTAPPVVNQYCNGSRGQARQRRASPTGWLFQTWAGG